jgi:hypothetical protein
LLRYLSGTINEDYGGSIEMPNEMPIQFGRGKMEQFSYLIVTGMFMLLMAAAMPYIAKGPLQVTDWYYEQYKIFYQLCGAGLGFIFAQVYIRLHTRKIRGAK